jgi:hypothetical protein
MVSMEKVNFVALDMLNGKEMVIVVRVFDL